MTRDKVVKLSADELLLVKETNKILKSIGVENINFGFDELPDQTYGSTITLGIQMLKKKLELVLEVRREMEERFR